MFHIILYSMIKTIFQLSKPVVYGTRQICLIENLFTAIPGMHLLMSLLIAPVHQKQIIKGIVAGYGSMKNMVPLWWTNIAMERSTIFNGKIHYKWPFSIAMLVHQRVKHMVPFGKLTVRPWESPIFDGNSSSNPIIHARVELLIYQSVYNLSVCNW